MPIKQIKLTFQAMPTTDQDVNISIAVDGSVKYDQTVPAVGTAIQGQTNPSAFVEFNLDVAAATANTQIKNHEFSITATNGRAKIETIAANYAFNYHAGNAIAGTANVFSTCDIVSQPLWNGQALTDRYNIAVNRDPIEPTGPGEVLIESGETVVFTLAVPQFNDSLPLPS